MPCDGSKESVSPGLATNNKLKSGSRLAGRKYFRCWFPGKSKPMRDINAIGCIEECKPRLGKAPVVWDLISRRRHSTWTHAMSKALRLVNSKEMSPGLAMTEAEVGGAVQCDGGGSS